MVPHEFFERQCRGCSGGSRSCGSGGDDWVVVAISGSHSCSRLVVVAVVAVVVVAVCGCRRGVSGSDSK